MIRFTPAPSPRKHLHDQERGLRAFRREELEAQPPHPDRCAALIDDGASGTFCGRLLDHAHRPGPAAERVDKRHPGGAGGTAAASFSGKGIAAPLRTLKWYG